VITKVLQAGNITYVAVRSKDCLSPRHLWSKIFAASVRVTQQNEVIERYDRVDSINALVWNLQRLLKQKPGKFVLVLEGVDKQRGAGPTLLPAIARLGDQAWQGLDP